MKKRTTKLCLVIVLVLITVFSMSLAVNAEVAPCMEFGYHQMHLGGIAHVRNEANTVSFMAGCYSCACGETMFIEGNPQYGYALHHYAYGSSCRYDSVNGAYVVIAKYVYYTDSAHLDGYRF